MCNVGDGLIVKTLGFSADGHWLCVWAIAINAAYDQCQFWAIGQDRSALDERVVKYHKVSPNIEDTGYNDVET